MKWLTPKRDPENWLALRSRRLKRKKRQISGDYFIIANGSSRPQIQALSDEVSEKMEKAGAVLKQVEGYDHAKWILLDFGDVIVHIFNQEDRLLYDLERIWRDGKQIDPDHL